GRLRARRTVPHLQHDAARAAQRRAADVAARRRRGPLLVRRHDGAGQRSLPGGRGEAHARSVRSAGGQARRSGGPPRERPPADDRASATRPPVRTDAPSPDGKRTAFIRDWNLWVRELATGKETQVTVDGVKDFGYATDNAGWTRSDRPIVVWSPDSKKIATFQQDQRGTGEMYLVDTRVGHPKREAWKYPLPRDATVTMIHRVAIDVVERCSV